MPKKLFTSAEVAQAAQEAIDNWMWNDVEDADKRIAALEHLKAHPQEVDATGFTDIWDWLDEYSKSTAANL